MTAQEIIVDIYKYRLETLRGALTKLDREFPKENLMKLIAYIDVHNPIVVGEEKNEISISEHAIQIQKYQDLYEDIYRFLDTSIKPIHTQLLLDKIQIWAKRYALQI